MEPVGNLSLGSNRHNCHICHPKEFELTLHSQTLYQSFLFMMSSVKSTVKNGCPDKLSYGDGNENKGYPWE